ncbi:FtsK/SpoIIIE domain-containing protein [Labrys portucalensis]|uniref:FtsK/SpoIIIE domain-containing protein n=1 Tax=Labrys neptuniae TaxID=376174 RepID=A0ABV6ZI63_9HYPH
MTSERMVDAPYEQCGALRSSLSRLAEPCDESDTGAELPDSWRETVYLRELLASREFTNSPSKLPLALGRTVDGAPLILSLGAVSNLLIAGTTGSGKSTAIDAVIMSLLCRLKPEECRMIMIDYMMMQFYDYDGIPHLLAPVISDMKEAVRALKWATREMEERNTKMAKLGVHDIDSYNRYVAEPNNGAVDLTPMHHIVIAIEEIVDLMIIEGRHFNEPILRLAQMGDSAGIHLIMATQRPYADVITDVIRESFPSRLSFQLCSRADSCVFLGEPGAEQLLGRGDALLKIAGLRMRLQGAFISEEEVEQVACQLKALGQPMYLEAVLAGEEDDEDEGEISFDEGGDLYDQALEVVMRGRRCSASYIQRKLGIGYNCATRIVKQMQKEGIVGPANHAGKREILVYSRDVRNGEEESQEDEE